MKLASLVSAMTAVFLMTGCAALDSSDSYTPSSYDRDFQQNLWKSLDQEMKSNHDVTEQQLGRF